MSEMVERVAKAILFCMNNGIGTRSEISIMAATLALQTMRRPTDEQRNAYYELSHKTETMFDAHWERAIDAALSADPKSEVQK